MTTALAGAGAARAQEDEDEEESREAEDDDSDPCADIKNPCGGEEPEAASDEGGGSDEKSDDDDERGGDDSDGDDGDDDASESAGADAEVAMSATVPAGKIAITAVFQIGLAKDSAGDPFSIAPDIWYGINAKLSAGVITSIQGRTGFWSGLAGTGICVSGENCLKRFDNIGAEAVYAIKADAPLSFAADVGLHALSFDPNTLAAKVGAKGAFQSGKLAIGFAPSLSIGLTERDANNKERIFLPVDASFMVSPSLHAGVQTGVTTTIEKAGDNYVVPVALGATYLVNANISAAAAFSLDSVLDGVDGNSATDARSLYIMLGYRI